MVPQYHGSTNDSHKLPIRPLGFDVGHLKIGDFHAGNFDGLRDCHLSPSAEQGGIEYPVSAIFEWQS